MNPLRLALLSLISLSVLTVPAFAQDAGLGQMVGDLSKAIGGDTSQSGELSGRIIQLVGLMTLLSLAPGMLVVMTSFTRFVIVLSMLRSALGLNQSPPNMVITSLALFMTFFVMQPVFEDAWNSGLSPLIDGSINEEQAIPKMAAPFHAFMVANTRDEDLALFHKMSVERTMAGIEKNRIENELSEGLAADMTALPENRSDVGWSVLIPSFMISELKRAFTIGFLIYIPFVAIDLIVAAILMGAGMMMLSPVMVSLPFKIIFFVLIDGWYMLAGSLMQSYVSP